MLWIFIFTIQVLFEVSYLHFSRKWGFGNEGRLQALRSCKLSPLKKVKVGKDFLPSCYCLENMRSVLKLTSWQLRHCALSIPSIASKPTMLQCLVEPEDFCQWSGWSPTCKSFSVLILMHFVITARSFAAKRTVLFFNYRYLVTAFNALSLWVLAQLVFAQRIL